MVKTSSEETSAEITIIKKGTVAKCLSHFKIY